MFAGEARNLFKKVGHLEVLYSGRLLPHSHELSDTMLNDAMMGDAKQSS
jgi:hypothetical protein